MLIGHSGSKLNLKDGLVEKLSTYLDRCKDSETRGLFLLTLSRQFSHAPQIVQIKAATITYKFIDGEADFKKADLGTLGRILRELHTVEIAGSPQKETGIDWLKGLATNNLRDKKVSFDISDVAELFATDDKVIVHGEPTDLVVDKQGEITILDWDEAGLGSKYQDLGYVYFKCHEQRNGDDDFQKFLTGYDDGKLDDKKIMRAAGLIAIAYSHWANTEFRMKFGTALLTSR